ncbi:hypothetical protein BJY04DRAFT_219559 [Aspergillus karnatakaensis]|uniref:putative lipase n=1 Tax=Aspergillus karnatakaensis TaxID=1810916 RepID=UPI003CCDC164
MRIVELLGVALASAIFGSASPIDSVKAQREHHDLASILAGVVGDPGIDDGITVGGAASPLDAAVSLSVSGVIPGDILNLLNGYLDLQPNKLDNKNPGLTDTSIYPYRKEEDAPYSVSEDKLRAAIYIPESFKYGKDGKKPVILVLATGIPAGLTYYFSFGKLASAMPEADVVWINIPGSSLADAQITAEYVAYAINYISAVAKSNVSVIAWSQGNLNTQWAFKYWPSTRDVVDDYVAVSPDYRGTVIADSVCPLLFAVFCMPSIFQQRWEKEFISVRRADGGGSAYVPTTTLYSTFDEIVQPMSGENASAILEDARGVGVTNNHVQTLCDSRPAGGVYTHEGMLYNPLSWALAVDALRHDGPGNISRIDLEKVCGNLIAPQLGVDELLGTEGLLLVALAEILAFSPKVLEEPAIASYAA